MHNKFSELMMLGTVTAVFFLGLAAVIVVPVQLYLKGDTAGWVCTGILGLFIYSILACFAVLGYQDRKQEKKEVEHE